MVVNTAHLRIQHKLFRVGLTDGTPEETTNRFASLVATWMYYRPEGEQSRGYQRIAFNYGDIRRASEIMVQSFFTIAKQCDADVQCEKMDEDSRFTYLSSIVTACNLLINSTFFHDLHNYEPFQMALNSRDRVFLHKIHRRLTYIASYKTGAAKLAFLGIPFLRQLLGESGIADFVNGRGGVQVELVKQSTPASSTRLYRWPSQNPDEYLRSMFNLPLDEESSPSSPCHSRVTSDNSRYSFGSTSTDSSSGVRSELSLLDSQLRSELLHSQAVSEAWIPDLTMTVKSHPELQLIHYLEYCGIDVACQAIGTSKPTCWMCSKYVECLNVDAQDSEGEAHGETAPRPEWFLNQNAGKIRCDWMVPSMAKEEVMEMVVEEVQRELENVMQEVALDCCF